MKFPRPTVPLPKGGTWRIVTIEGHRVAALVNEHNLGHAYMPVEDAVALGLVPPYSAKP